MARCARGPWPHKTLYNWFVRWSRIGIDKVENMFAMLKDWRRISMR